MDSITIAKLAYLEALRCCPELAEAFPVPDSWEEGSSGGGCTHVFGGYNNRSAHIMVDDGNDNPPTDPDSYCIGFYDDDGQYVRSFYMDTDRAGQPCLWPTEFREPERGDTALLSQLSKTYTKWLDQNYLPHACMQELSMFGDLNGQQDKTLSAFLNLWEALEEEGKE